MVRLAGGLRTKFAVGKLRLELGKLLLRHTLTPDPTVSPLQMN